MGKIISPEEFVKTFREVAGYREKELFKLWWSSNAKYTDRILTNQGGVLAEVSKRLELEYRQEKVRMDAMLYQPINGVRAISVAVEHENDGDSSFDEMWRLSLLNVPLKVLITYPSHGEEALMLGRYANIAEALDVYGDFHVQRRQLVIFGFSDYPNRSIEWRCYVLSPNGFMRMEVKS